MQQYNVAYAEVYEDGKVYEMNCVRVGGIARIMHEFKPRKSEALKGHGRIVSVTISISEAEAAVPASA